MNRLWKAFRVILSVGFVVVQIWFVLSSSHVIRGENNTNLQFDTKGKPILDKTLELFRSLNEYFLESESGLF